MGAMNNAAKNWWGKWFILAFAAAIASRLTKRGKISVPDPQKTGSSIYHASMN